eukprot:TRINITY_DN7760_c0_g1_i9.p1 TRINITY_DN7760_c0_g1~~TRINITY_DN7760_c0_g1_i9.p1  ORF type:complete len:399 (+),score=25.22 TRINITY_DN7760_c0_g1_i9:138-1334(+)
MSKGVISLFWVLLVDAIVGHQLVSYGAEKVSVVKGVLKANVEQFPVVIELSNITNDALAAVNDESSIHYFEGKIFEKPTKVIWFHNSNANAPLKEIDKAASIIYASDNATFSLYIDSVKTWPSNRLSLVYNHTMLTPKGLFQKLRYEVPYTNASSKIIEVQLPFEEAHQYSITKGKRKTSSPVITEYNRTIEGSGAHRSIVTNFHVSAKSLNNCKLSAVEPILEQHFVEIDFLNDIVGCKYWINENCNIELPSAHVPQYLMVFYFDELLSSEFYTMERTGDGYRVQYKFPYHFRYQPAGVNKYEPVEILNPLVYLSCDETNEKLDDLEAILLKYVVRKEKGINVKYAQTPKIWRGEVPTGLLKDKQVVAALTIVLTVVAVAVILLVAFGKNVPNCYNS